MKRVLTMQDMSCFGKCSVTVALPLISAFCHEVVAVPTAILSTHTGPYFKNYYVKDLTEDIEKIVNHLSTLHESFDCIYTGYLCEGEQTKIVKESILKLKTENTIIVVDPAMADEGKLYPGFSSVHINNMKELCKIADVSIPNITEAAMMANYTLKENNINEALEIIKILKKEGFKSIVITSVKEDDLLGVVVSDENNNIFKCFNKQIDINLHGTGDVFASLFVGEYLRCKDINRAVEFAVKFTIQAINLTLPDLHKHYYSVEFEKIIPYINEGEVGE